MILRMWRSVSELFSWIFCPFGIVILPWTLLYLLLSLYASSLPIISLTFFSEFEFEFGLRIGIDTDGVFM